MAEFTEKDRALVWTAAHTTPAVDVRVFINPSEREKISTPGIDALLTTPEMLAEFFRRRAFLPREVAPDPENVACMSSLTITELADIVWRHLFLDNSPVSEPVRIVLTTLGMFGLDVASGNLRLLREQYAAIPEAERKEKALELANVNLVLYPVEALEVDTRDKQGARRIRNGNFRPVLSLTSLFAEWKEAAKQLRQRGFGARSRLDEFTTLELRRFLHGVIEDLSPAAVSVDWPEGGHTASDNFIGRLMRETVLPLCGETGLACMIASGPTEIDDLSSFWADFPEVRFLLFPGGEEQFAPAAIEAFNSRNLLLCGPDQPLSFPRVLRSYLGLRLETLGSTFHACHSGVALEEAMVGCWAHMRWTLGTALIRHYMDLWRTGWKFDKADIQKDVGAILGENVRIFLGLPQ